MKILHRVLACAPDRVLHAGLLAALKSVHLNAILKEEAIHHSYVGIGRDLHRYDIA